MLCVCMCLGCGNYTTMFCLHDTLCFLLSCCFFVVVFKQKLAEADIWLNLTHLHYYVDQCVLSLLKIIDVSEGVVFMINDLQHSCRSNIAAENMIP